MDANSPIQVFITAADILGPDPVVRWIGEKVIHCKKIGLGTFQVALKILGPVIATKQAQLLALKEITGPDRDRDLIAGFLGVIEDLDWVATVNQLLGVLTDAKIPADLDLGLEKYFDLFEGILEANPWDDLKKTFLQFWNRIQTAKTKPAAAPKSRKG
jgi:hypothetical protein